MLVRVDDLCIFHCWRLWQVDLALTINALQKKGVDLSNVRGTETYKLKGDVTIVECCRFLIWAYLTLSQLAQTSGGNLATPGNR